MNAGRFAAVFLMTAVLGASAQQARPAPNILRFFISEGTPQTGYRPPDRELALWAFEAWAKHADGTIQLQPAAEQAAAVRLYWAPANGSTYGETRPRIVNGQQGAEVFVMADTGALGPDIGGRAKADPLWRDTIVYLTCLHELGHALGLMHTADQRDIMYFFGYGGDIVEYFARYRRQLRERSDIRSISGLSASDIERLMAARRRS